ncbi:MAG: hypothetical protein HQK51_00790 [Oligoflexia bacterium]|nr:hypothetical protein [Oligoflexia bacterium]
MRGILKNYFLLAAHPFKYQRYFRKKRLGDLHNMELPEVVPEKQNFLRLEQAILISWVLVIFKSFLILFLFNIAYKSFINDLGLFEEILIALKGDISESDLMPIFAYIVIFFRAVHTIFFPVIAFLCAFIVEILISFMVRLRGDEDNIKENLASREDVLSNVFCSYLFYPIPVIGSVLQKISFIVYLYAGLKNNYNFSRSYIFLITCIPFFLFLAFSLLFMILIKLILS